MVHVCVTVVAVAMPSLLQRDAVPMADDSQACVTHCYRATAREKVAATVTRDQRPNHLLKHHPAHDPQRGGE